MHLHPMDWNFYFDCKLHSFFSSTVKWRENKTGALLISLILMYLITVSAILIWDLIEVEMELHAFFSIFHSTKWKREYIWGKKCEVAIKKSNYILLLLFLLFILFSIRFATLERRKNTAFAGEFSDNDQMNRTKTKINSKQKGTGLIYIQ